MKRGKGAAPRAAAIILGHRDLDRLPSGGCASPAGPAAGAEAPKDRPRFGRKRQTVDARGSAGHRAAAFPVTSPAKKADKPEGKAKFKPLPKRAQCWNDISGAGVELQVNYHVRIKNVGTAPGTVEVTPVRYYSDGSSNDSAADNMTATIAPGEVQSVMGSWDTDQDHLLVACEAYVSGSDDDTYDSYSIPWTGSLPSRPHIAGAEPRLAPPANAQRSLSGLLRLRARGQRPPCFGL